MSILKTLPFSLCQSGLTSISGIGNYTIQILASSPSQSVMSTIFLLDSHGQVPSEVHNPDYAPIHQSQIDWFTRTSQSLRKEREKNGHKSDAHLSLVFQHIPLPEFGEPSVIIRAGARREPTEGPSVNTHFYDALVKEKVAAIGCGHDHVNDFCALLPRSTNEMGRDGHVGPAGGLWLCHGGGSGFGGYCSYGGVRYHRRMRVWEIDGNTGGLKTWTRIEYQVERTNELIPVQGGAVAFLDDGPFSEGPEPIASKYVLI